MRAFTWKHKANRHQELCQSLLKSCNWKSKEVGLEDQCCNSRLQFSGISPSMP